MPLVGRERELRILLDAFAGLLEGEPRAVWMSGAPGAGKSRLLDELKARARDSTARSLIVHAKWYEGEGIELGPLSNALEVLRPALAAPLAARIYRDGAVATVDAAVEAVQIVSRRYPVVLILDDLHYLNSSSELGRFVAAIEEIPLLLVVTTRPVENPALRSFRSALAGSIPPQELEIGPLDGAGIAEAATALFGTEPPEGMLGQIADLSAGLPLALREVFRELIAAEHLVPIGEGWDWRTASLPDDDLRAIGDRVHGFSGRLASLPVAERRILALAAYLGEQFNRDLLRHLCERTIGWDDHAFERLIIGGFIAVSTPSIRFGAREQEGRVCYAFMHTLLWKAAGALEIEGIPGRRELAAIILDILMRGAGELYTVAPLEVADVCALDESDLARLFSWLVVVGRKLSPIYAEAYVALCRATLEPCRTAEIAITANETLLDGYLEALSVYGDRLYITGAREALHNVTSEITAILERFAGREPRTAGERMIRLDAAVVVWKDALMQGDPERAKGFLDELLKVLPQPAEQSDRELRGAAEAIRLLASYWFGRGEFAEGLDLATPYIGEMDRMRPETLNALFKVLLPAMLTAGRLSEAGQIVESGLRLRREADLFTEYELLWHAANYARIVRDFRSLRQYATEARNLVDRYPAYRNLSTNYFFLPYVAACEGNPDELARLENDFQAVPPPTRSSPEQVTGAKYQFMWAWNLLGVPERALKFARELNERGVLSPLLRMRVAEEELRSYIDLRKTESIPDVLQRFHKLSEQLGDDYLNPESTTGRRARMLRLLAESLSQSEPDGLREYVIELKDDIEDVDGIRAARLLLEAAEKSSGRKREFNDAAYTALELALKEAQQEAATGFAHHHLDQLASLLPKTRLSRFRQMVGDDPRIIEEIQVEHKAGIEVEQHDRKILRAFGALRIEGVDDVGAKLESKTRTLVAALVVSKLGDTRSLGELTRDRLADLLWPDMPSDKAVNNLHATLSYARRFLGGSNTVLQSDGVYTLGDDVAIDAVEFRESVKKGNRLYSEGVYFGAAAAYRHALDLATGDFLEGMYAEWVDTVRETLRGELATALERLIGLEIDREEYAAVPALAERLLALDDLHDGAYEALIRSAAARGARREAFSYFNRYEVALDAYGAGPARKITELMNRVRAGDA
ncbi:MAG: Bacterial transcriptional activator domain protein [Chlorobi bacterium]|nr:Bacterial transcriptional activator domain protein [Chlorobiota bacterium]